MIDGPWKEEKSIDSFIAEQNLTVIPAEKWEAPADFNFHALEWLGIDETRLREMVKGVTEVINKPIIVDRFSIDHTARRQWRDEMLHQYGEKIVLYLRDNKLRKGSFSTRINALINPLEFRLGKIEDPRKVKISAPVANFREHYSNIVKEYDKMDTDQKIEAVRKIDLLLKDLLAALQ